MAELVADYGRDGFAYVRGLFEPADLAPLIDALDEGGGSPGGFAVTDSEGGQQELSVWLELGDDLIGIIPRLEPMVAVATAVVGEPVYHWHSKLSWKRPGASSLWDWHQDYGFWSEFGVARPAMCTVAIALGPVDTVNGCLQLIRGSHLLGALPVEPVGQTRGSDPSAVAEAIESDGIEHCELELGDAVVFHANTLHGSGPKRSSDLPTLPNSIFYH